MKETVHQINPEELTLSAIADILDNERPISLSGKAVADIEKSHKYLHEKIATSPTPVYGINTGFGSLCNVKISEAHLAELQENLVMSHACGTGKPVPAAIVRLMLLLKVQSLSYGHSGVRLETVQRLVDFFNEGVLPVVYEQGSLGASGDLAPLAHLSLPLLGKGRVYYKGEETDAEKILAKKRWKPLQLQAKEGLALLNGTQFMSAYGVYTLIKAQKLSWLADVIGALSADAFDCNLSPFDPLVHMVRPHSGQVKTAALIRELLEGSQIAATEKEDVQDPYSFRCMPQVHGATKDTLDFVRKTLKTEINAVTDNPNIFVEDDKIISGGNFHGQPLALALDYMGIALAELGNISERRTYQLISGRRGLPEFLISNPGLHSGFMIPQYTAASIVSRNKQFATPASVDSIVSSNGQEDHVSMGANAAVKCLQIAENLQTVLTIELFNAAQALEFRRPAKTSDFLESLVENYRREVPFVEEDTVMADLIHTSEAFIENLAVDPDLIF